ncbi:MAG: hypothetical protein IK095_05770 [Oscillospiraceae bacterium]|nr:hypothetical protein [Oscillospiraceae bacterium]
MIAPKPLLEGKTIENAAEDFRAARKVEQYRIGRAALYLPQGLRWGYIPYAEIQSAELSRRVISAGHCVTVREEKPAVDIKTAAGLTTLALERPESMQLVLDAVRDAQR